MTGVANKGVIAHAPAKVNLCLRVVGKNDDGYHLLDSVVVFTDFGDEIEIEMLDGAGGQAADDDNIIHHGPFADALNGARDHNICYHALTAFRAAVADIGNCAPIGPVKISINKQIPVGAGLGGGSADAAAVLRCLNQINPVPLSAKKLAEIGLSIGADVPACLAAKSLRMSGIGDIIEPLQHAPHGHILLANPGHSLATIDVFKAMRFDSSDRIAEIKPLPPTAQLGDDAAILAGFGNDLEVPAATLVPQITGLLKRMAGLDGAKAAQMSGSGASCFALFDTPEACSTAKQRLNSENIWAIATKIS